MGERYEVNASLRVRFYACFCYSINTKAKQITSNQLFTEESLRSTKYLNIVACGD